MKNNIDNLRKEAGLTVQQLAEKAGMSRIYLQEVKSGRKRMNEDIIKRLAAALNCRPQDIISDDGTQECNTVPLVGYVGAGAEVSPIDDHAQGAGLDEIEAPQGLNLYGYVAVRVRGDSMFPRYFENEVIAFKRNVDWSNECLNKECVVKLKDGRCFVKIVRAGSKDGLFTLESFNAPLIYDIEIEWACCKLVRL